MRKFCLADKTVNSFVIAVYMPMMCWRNGVLVNWKNDDLFSHLVSKWHPDYDPTECNEMFDWCIKNHDDVDIATFFYHCQKYNITFK